MRKKMRREKVGVLIHGYNIEKKNWREVVWGRGNLMGRLPKGALVTLEEGAEVIVFGTGASQTKEGKIEAEVMRDTLVEQFFRLEDFSAFSRIDLTERVRDRIEKISRLETESRNTREELQFAGEIFREERIEKVILVSSPDHISRCLRDAYVVFIENIDFYPFEQRLYATPSQVSYTGRSVRDVQIIEPR